MTIGIGVTAARDIYQVLRSHGVPFFARHRNYTFQHDQVRSNSERATGDFLQQNNIEVMAWYTFSLWAEIQNRDTKRQNEVQSRQTTAAELDESFLGI